MEVGSCHLDPQDPPIADHAHTVKSYESVNTVSKNDLNEATADLLCALSLVSASLDTRRSTPLPRVAPASESHLTFLSEIVTAFLIPFFRVEDAKRRSAWILEDATHDPYAAANLWKRARIRGYLERWTGAKTRRVWNCGAKKRGADVPGSSRHVNKVTKRQREFNLLRVLRMCWRSTRVGFRHRLTPPLEVVNKEPPVHPGPTLLR